MITGNSPLWSLSYEWWFYMLYLPLITLVSWDHRRNVLIFAVNTGLTLLYTIHPTFFFRLGMYFAIWWAGAQAAACYRLYSGRLLFPPLMVPIANLVVITLILTVSALRDAGSGTARVNTGLHPWLEPRHFAFALLSLGPTKAASPLTGRFLQRRVCNAWPAVGTRIGSLVPIESNSVGTSQASSGLFRLSGVFAGGNREHGEPGTGVGDVMGFIVTE